MIGVSNELGNDSAENLRALVLGVLSEDALSRIFAQPTFSTVSLALLDNWAPHAEDDASMTRTLRDVGHYMAGVWALGLHGSPGGLTHVSLSRLTGPLGLGSKTRVHAMLAYLQFIGLIRPAPARGDGRFRRYDPTPALDALFRARFRRELGLSAPLIPEAAAVLDRWDEPGVYEAFMQATARFMAGSYLTLDRATPSLEPIGHRNAGLTVLGQLVTLADGAFPPRVAEVNLSELAKRSGVSRQQVRNILKIGEQSEFWRMADNRLTFTPEFDRQVRHLVAFYVLHMGWCARQALAGASAVRDRLWA